VTFIYPRHGHSRALVAALRSQGYLGARDGLSALHGFYSDYLTGSRNSWEEGISLFRIPIACNAADLFGDHSANPSVYHDYETFFAAAMPFITQARETGGIFALYTHHYGDDADCHGTGWGYGAGGVIPRDLEWLVDLVRVNNGIVVPLGQAVSYYRGLASAAEIGDDLVWIPRPVSCYVNSFIAERSDNGVSLSWTVVGLPASSCLRVYREECAGQWESVSSEAFCGGAVDSCSDLQPPVGATRYWLVEDRGDGQLQWLCSTVAPQQSRSPSLVLRANVPNPFNPHTTIRFFLPAAGQVRLSIHDTRGRRIVELAVGRQVAGEQTATWNGKDGEGAAMPAGVYFVRLVWEQHQQTCKILLVR